MKTGDVVYLEDRPMTVESVIDDRVYCAWFEGTDLHRDVFAISQLEERRNT